MTLLSISAAIRIVLGHKLTAKYICRSLLHYEPPPGEDGMRMISLNFWVVSKFISIGISRYSDPVYYGIGGIYSNPI